MKALLFHSKNYESKFDSFSNRPKNIIHEKLDGKEKQKCEDCIVAFITVEKKDKLDMANKISHEIKKMWEEVRREKAVICPFAHLSNNLAEPKKALKIIEIIESNLKDNLNVIRAHFGSNKSLLLEVYGHTGNVRFREF